MCTVAVRDVSLAAGHSLTIGVAVSSAQRVCRPAGLMFGGPQTGRGC